MVSTMIPALLTTKLYIPPHRPNWVYRLRLLERLNDSLHNGCKLTLVSAPAGFGKTTLVTEWVDHLSSASKHDQQELIHTAWLSLDEGDNEPVVFFAYLAAAVHRPPGAECSSKIRVL